MMKHLHLDDGARAVSRLLFLDHLLIFPAQISLIALPFLLNQVFIKRFVSLLFVLTI